MKRLLMAAGGAAVLLSSALGVSYAQGAKVHPLAHVRHAELQVAASALGLADARALRKELAGTTLTAVAQEHNVLVSTVSDAISADLTAKIQAAATDGTIKPARATKLTQKLSTWVDKFMTHEFKAAKTS